MYVVKQSQKLSKCTQLQSSAEPLICCLIKHPDLTYT